MCRKYCMNCRRQQYIQRRHMHMCVATRLQESSMLLKSSKELDWFRRNSRPMPARSYWWRVLFLRSIASTNNICKRCWFPFFRCLFPFFKFAYIFEALTVTSVSGPLSLLNGITCIWNLQWYAFTSVTCGCIPIWMLSFPVNLFNLLDSSLCQVTHFY